MLSERFIELSQTGLAAPIVFTQKKDGALRYCVDYRKLNAVTKRDVYPPPQMHRCID